MTDGMERALRRAAVRLSVQRTHTATLEAKLLVALKKYCCRATDRGFVFMMKTRFAASAALPVWSSSRNT